MIIEINFSSSVHHPAHVAVFSFHNGNYRSDHGATQVQSTYLVIEYIIVVKQLFSKNILIYFSALQCWCISIEGICACVHSCLVLCKTFYNHLKLALVFVFIVSPRKCEHHALLTTECIQYISGSTQQLSRDTRTMFNSLFFEHTDIAQKSFLSNAFLMKSISTFLDM